MDKKTFSSPELTIHGDIEKITLNGILENADVPGGNDNSADCPASGCPTS